MVERLDDSTLVCGMAFPGGHDFNPGEQKLTGATCKPGGLLTWTPRTKANKIHAQPAITYDQQEAALQLLGIAPTS